MSNLAEKHCIPCKGGSEPLKGDALSALLGRLASGWELVDEHHLSRSFRLKNFAEALAYVNRIGQLAEEQQHHPDIHLAWGKVRIELWTHKIDGLTESDFVFAAKTDLLWAAQAG